MKFQRKKVATALGVGGFAMLAAGSVWAQDIRVNVTGTNIKRVDSETAAPIETITREDIQASGFQTISAVVQAITANNNGSISNTFVNGFAAGASGVSLRGLGPNNTLVLLNGRRLASYGLADDGHISFVDLNQVPFDSVERIEILKDGASAIYGSDAVAGVVNIILRQQFTGVTVSGNYGVTAKGDGDLWKGAITAGIGDLTKDRYNVFLTVEGQKQKVIPMTNRPDYIGSNNLTFMGGPDSNQGNPLSGYGANSPIGNVRRVDAAGNSIGLYQPLAGGCISPGYQDDQWCRFDTKNFLQIQPEQENINVLLKGAYQINNTTQLYGDFMYFQTKLDTTFTPQGLRSTWPNASTFGVNSTNTPAIALPIGHPDNPFTDSPAALYYSPFDVGGRNTTYESHTERYLAGIKGTNWNWDWDVGALYIKSTTDITQTGYLNYPNLLNALSGQGGFGYYRVGINAPLNNPGIYGYISPTLPYTAIGENTQFDAKASRDLMKLEGGSLALAIGTEYRREEIDNPGTPNTFTGDIVGRGYTSGEGSRNIFAMYAEVYAPILKNLEATVAIRYDDYSDFGSTWNPKVGVKWTALPSLVFRGTYATGFRAPGLLENGNSQSAGFVSIIDPVRCPVTDAPLDCGQGTTVISNTGNPFIKPETSTNWTVGGIWEPLPGLSLTLDYWNIEIKDQIGFSNTQLVVDNPSQFPAAVIIRDSSDNLPGIPNSGTLQFVGSPYINLAVTKTDGIDLDFIYRWNMKEYGNLTSELQWTHILNYSTQYSNGTKLEFQGTMGNTDISAGLGTPQDRVNVIIGWDRGPWNVTGTVRYISDYKSIGSKQSEGECLSPLDNVESGCHVSSFTTLDLSASYRGFKNWVIFGSVLNVFDRIAPFNPAAVGSSYNYNYNYANQGAIGTQFNIGARYTFN